MNTLHIALYSFASVSLLVSAGCASTSTTQVASADQSDEDIICRRVHEVGSRLSSRQCKTRAAWEAEADEAREALERNDRVRIGDRGGPVFPVEGGG